MLLSIWNAGLMEKKKKKIKIQEICIWYKICNKILEKYTY